MKLNFLTILIFLCCSSASARFGGDGVFLDLNLHYSLLKSQTKNDGQSTQSNSDLQATIYDFKLGYIFPISWYLGVIHSMRSENVLNRHENYGAAQGISVGYLSYTGPFFMVHYYFQANRGEYSRGTGTQVDVGYKFEANDRWVFGLEMSQRTLTYKRSDTMPLLDYYKVSETFPMASVGYLF